MWASAAHRTLGSEAQRCLGQAGTCLATSAGLLSTRCSKPVTVRSRLGSWLWPASKVFTRHLAFSSVFAKRVIQAAAERDSGFRCCRGSLRPRPVPFSHLACLVVPVRGRGWRRAGVRPPQHRVHVQAWPCLLSLEVCAQLFGSSVSSLVAGRSDIADSFPRSGQRQPVCGYWA